MPPFETLSVGNNYSELTDYFNSYYNSDKAKNHRNCDISQQLWNIEEEEITKYLDEKLMTVVEYLTNNDCLPQKNTNTCHFDR